MLQLFYFSGTGNARNVAQWLAAEWRARDRQASVSDLTKVQARSVQIGDGDEVGFASPTHGFNFPPVTLDFLFAFPRAPNRNRAFIVNTRAGVRLLGLHLPGLSGAAQMLAAFVLLAKGYRVVGMRPIDLPSNWISIHPGLREDNVRAIYDRCSAITRRFAERLLDGKRDYRALWDLPQDLLITPVSLGYYLIGRFWFAKSFIASGACDACGVCIKGCPVKALSLVDGRPFWSYRCESCMRCMNQCPKRAIETAHGFAVAVPVLLSLGLSALVYPVLRNVAPAWMHDGAMTLVVRNVLEAALMLLVLFGSYRLLHRALRWRWFERLVVWTSLTHFGFWRRYRAPKR
jgi:ferredoxin